MLILFSCSKQEYTDDFELTKSIPNEQVDTVIVQSSNLDKTEWTLRAVQVRRFEKNDITKITNIDLDIYEDNGSISNLKAHRGYIYGKKNLMCASGNVRFISEEKQLFGDSLLWNRNNDKIYSEDWVTIIRRGDTLYGRKLEADSSLEHIKLEQVSAKGIIEKEEVNWERKNTRK